jgi:predicted PurR-regulated permease PerM
MLWYNSQDNIVFILFVFLVAMFIVYFDYMLNIVSLSLCLCISLYNIHPNVHRVGGRDHVSMVLICYSLRAFISIILVFGVVTKEQSKTTQFAFNHHVLSAYEESQAWNSQ